MASDFDLYQLTEEHDYAPWRASVMQALTATITAPQTAGKAIHPTLIHSWKKQLVTGCESIFAGGTKTTTTDGEALQAELYEQIGRLKMELEWLKKKVGASA